ncbi:MAG: 30S ribosome-binding factor RbfA [Mycobacteriales bacterium]
MVDRARARRLAVRIRQVVAQTLERQIKDPRLSLVTVTDARLTGDLREATIFYTVLGDDAQWADSAAALASATGLVRSTVGRALGVRFTPTITFVADHVPSEGRRVDALLAAARAADATLTEVRAGKSPAGESDPYRHREDDDDLAADGVE